MVYNIMAERYEKYIQILIAIQEDTFSIRKPFTDTLLKFLEYAQKNGWPDIQPEKLCGELCFWVQLLEESGQSLHDWEGIDFSEPVVLLTSKEHGVSKEVEENLQKLYEEATMKEIQAQADKRRLFNVFWKWAEKQTLA